LFLLSRVENFLDEASDAVLIVLFVSIVPKIYISPKPLEHEFIGMAG
jgi:hypothetical protein